MRDGYDLVPREDGMKYPDSKGLGYVRGPEGRNYSQHFYGENEGMAVNHWSLSGERPNGVRQGGASRACGRCRRRTDQAGEVAARARLARGLAPAPSRTRAVRVAEAGNIQNDADRARSFPGGHSRYPPVPVDMRNKERIGTDLA